MHEEILTLPESGDPERLVQRLGEAYNLAPDGPRARQLHYFDTFDWALYRRGLALVREGSTYRLEDRRTGAVHARQSVARGSVPRTAAGFATGPVRAAIEPVTTVRALLHIAGIRRDGRRWRLLNADAKTVVRVVAERITLARNGEDRPVLGGITLLPLRGYDEEAAEISRALRRAGAETTATPLLDAALASAGVKPCAYSGKVDVDLAPDLTARQAAVRILRHLLRTMRANEPGIRQDIDTEFLHDFRVAIRRTRSALATLTGVFPPEPVASFQREFRATGEYTGPVRDLDVYLLRRPEYTAVLPAELRPGLEPLFAALAGRRTAAQRRLVAALSGDPHRDLIARWERFLGREEQRRLDDSRRASLPAEDLARWALRKRYRRMLKRGRSIDDATPDEQLHRMRIDGKKLRYLLEFFAALFPARPQTRLVKQLKTLQDNLGDFNDLSVQLADLRAMLAAEGDQAPSAAAAAALGGLIVQLRLRKRGVRKQFGAAFATFASERTASLFATLGVDR
jgi:CHAD domain-containing protein